MEQINWAKYSYEDFTLFCNALLSFEFGRGFRPFNAPGKDGGVDGSFVGRYENSQGVYRFQYKFHSVARKDAFYMLKTQVKNEAGKIKDETDFVLLTNVELLPREASEIENVFVTQIKQLGLNCRFMLWDGAKLFTLYIRYPLLQLWMDEGFTTSQLQDYRNYFSRNLESKYFQPSTFSNFFVARQDSLDNLNDFMNEEQNVAVIFGEAGIGKTRLVVEFFQRFVDTSDDWSALVLVNRNIDFDKLKKAFSGERKLIILLDDAHTYHATTIADLKALVGLFGKTVKLIFTIRTLEVFSSMIKIKEFDKRTFFQIQLTELTRSDTEVAFLRYLENTGFEHYIHDLVKISHGKPILIVAILDAVQRGVPVASIKGQYFLHDYVIGYFDSYIERVHQETSISRLKAKLILQNIVLIEPFSFQDSKMVNRLAILHKIESEDVRFVLKVLVENLFVSGKYEQAVKPDYYSDILLAETNRQEIEQYIEGFPEFVNKIIVNLSGAEESDKSKSGLLDEILVAFTSNILTTTDEKVLNEILDTVDDIAYLKQDIAVRAVRDYITSIKKEGHPSKLEYVDSRQSAYRSAHGPSNKVSQILFNLLYKKEFYPFVFEAGLHLFVLTNDKKYAKVFDWAKRDVIERCSLVRQNFFLKKVSSDVTISDSNISYFIEVMRLFLELHFSITEMNGLDRNKINYTTYYLPGSSTIKKFREKIIDTLEVFFGASISTVNRLDVVKLIVDIPRSIFATDRNAKPYKNDSEILKVLDFFKRKAEDFLPLEKKEIIDRLFWYKQWGISESFYDHLADVETKLKPRNVIEELTQIFSKAENQLHVINNVDDYFFTKCQYFVQIVGPEELAKAIEGFLKPQPYTPHYFWEFLRVISNEYPEYAVVLHDYLFEHNSQMYNAFASAILGYLYFTKGMFEFYWKSVDKLIALDNIESDNTLLAVYASRVPGTVEYSKRDLSVIYDIFVKKRPENRFVLSRALQTLIAADYKNVELICADFLSVASQREAEFFFIFLKDNKKASPTLTSALVLNHSIRFYLSYEIEICLATILKSEGVESIFKYVLARYYFKKEDVEKTGSLLGYNLLPNADHSHLFDGVETNDLRFAAFVKAAAWYVTSSFGDLEIYFAKDVPEYFLPGEFLDQGGYDFFNAIVEDSNVGVRQLMRIADLLSLFHNKNEALIALVLKIYAKSFKFHSVEERELADLRTDLYVAVTTLGIKSGVPGQPFQVDLDLKMLVESMMKKFSEFDPELDFLKAILRSVDTDIDRHSDYDNETW